MTRTCGAWLGVLALASLTPLSAAQSPGRAVLRSVQTTVQDDITIVTIEADGPLPEPVSGAGRPRIFRLHRRDAQSQRDDGDTGQGAVKQARVALCTTAPDVTRVALDLRARDLPALTPTRGSQDASGSGRLAIRGDSSVSSTSTSTSTSTTTTTTTNTNTSTNTSNTDRAETRLVAAGSWRANHYNRCNREHAAGGNRIGSGASLTGAGPTEPGAPRRAGPGGDSGGQAAGQRHRELSPATVRCARAARISPIGARRD